VLQQVVNLLAANPSLKLGQAIQQVAKKTAGRDWKKCWARLRKRYPKLKASGSLPKPQTEDATREKIAAEFREVYRRDAARLQAAKEQRAHKEKEAESLGLQIEGQNLYDLLQTLEKERERIGGIIHHPLESVVYRYKNEGIDVEDAIARHLKYRDKYELLEKQIAVLVEIRALQF